MGEPYSQAIGLHSSKISARKGRQKAINIDDGRVNDGRVKAVKAPHVGFIPVWCVNPTVEIGNLNAVFLINMDA